MGFLQTIIGLEIHIELKTKSKMFCGCSADYFGQPPNTRTCPVCLGLPGALPVANKKAIDWVVKAGLALGCQIPLFSKFDRKNYFYPDLPKGYQISQYDLPFCKEGKLKVGDSMVGITRVHLEEDTAKLVHKGDFTLIDFNRSGVPLMEVVTEPKVENSQQAKDFLKKLQQIIRFLNISDCDMEKGSMRCEANISLAKAGTRKLPDYKVEIKNLNSFKFVQKALEYEIKRQGKLLHKGEKPAQETRGWNEEKQKTYTQRWKEEAQDYRYFPEPDLPPIRWQKEEIEKLKRELPELPDLKIDRFVKEFSLPNSQAKILVADQKRADYFEQAVKLGKKGKLFPKEIANVIINKRVNLKKHTPAQLIKVLAKRKTQPKMSGVDLKGIVIEVIKKNPKPVEDFRQGNKNAVEFLLGMVMRETKGQSDPSKAREMLLDQLKKNN